MRRKWDRGTHSINGYGLSLDTLILDTVRPEAYKQFARSFLRPDKGRP